MDTDCSLCCMFCKRDGVLYVNYACFHGVCNYHKNEINPGGELICNHCKAKVKILKAEAKSIPKCEYCAENDGNYQIPTCKHWLCAGCVQEGMSPVEDKWYCPICYVSLENPTHYFRTQREIKEKQENAPIVSQKQFNEKNIVKNNEEEKKEAMPKKFGYNEKINDLPDLVSNIQLQKSEDMDLPDIRSNIQNLQSSEESLPDISGIASNPLTNEQNPSRNIGYNNQHQEEFDLPNIDPTLAEEQKCLDDSSINTSYGPNKSQSEQNYSFNQSNEFVFEKNLEATKMPNDLEISPLKIEPEIDQRQHQTEFPDRMILEEPKKKEELVLQCSNCYAWFLEIIKNGNAMYCGLCKKEFCPICLKKKDDHVKCTIVKESSMKCTLEDIYNINIELDKKKLMIQRCPDCMWLQTYDKLENGFNNYGACREPNCHKKRFCLICSSSDINPEHGCLNHDKAKKEIRYREIRGFCFPRSFFERRI